MKKMILFTCLTIISIPIDALADESVQPRVAIVIGANKAAPGRRMLRYAYNDARNMKDVLQDVGIIQPENIHIRLDPNPSEVLKLLDQQLLEFSKLPKGTLLIFYYSGHADEHAIYPNGEALTYAELQRRLDDDAAEVRIGIIDTCRGGGWTGTRGLKETEVFKVNIPMELSNQGSILIASSSGLEDAHESSDLKGGFFTHHFNAALRGAADRNGDRRITVTEAFEYAKSLTIRDTSLYTKTPQHPSYKINLRGRQDLVLATLETKMTQVSVEQTHGPLQFVHLDSGLIVLELPRGKQSLLLALPKGRYLVRTSSGKMMRAKEVEVHPDKRTNIREDQLKKVDKSILATRASTSATTVVATVEDNKQKSTTSSIMPVIQTITPASMWWIRFALGVSHGQISPGFGLGDNDSDITTLFQAAYGFTDRFHWLIPTAAFAYRWGDVGGFEWIPWGGLVRWGFGVTSSDYLFIFGRLAVGVDLRLWLSSSNSLIAGAGLSSDFKWTSDKNTDRDAKYGPETWDIRIALGYSHTLRETVTFNLACAYIQNVVYRESVPEFKEQAMPKIGIGSIQTLALRTRPIIEIYISDVVSIDAHASVEYHFSTESFEETYLFGASFLW